MVTLTEDQVRVALEDVHDPHVPISLGAMGMLSDVVVTDGCVDVKVSVPCTACPAMSALDERVRERLALLEGVREVTVTMGPHLPWDREKVDAQARSLLRKSGILI